jgi:hypothetical protein
MANLPGTADDVNDENELQRRAAWTRRAAALT